MSTKDINRLSTESQEEKLFKKLIIKKSYNENVIDYLQSIGEKERAENIRYCGNNIGITTINNVAKIVKADFCRERLCNICAWRRQSKFIAQTFPIISILENKGYKFLFVTLTVKNMAYEDLDNAVNEIIKGYELLRKRRKIKRAWSGIVRSIELSYNSIEHTFHPHIHLLIAVKDTYFKDKDMYITQEELTHIWKDCIDADYIPIVNIKMVNDNCVGAVETLKYSLKPNQARECFDAFFYILRGRRLISFSGIFSKIRKELKYTDFENILTDDVETNQRITYNLYTFDATGGIYRFQNSYEL